MGKMLKEHLQASFGCEVLFLHGGVPKKQRDRMLERFQEGKEYLPIFVLSLKAGGTGLTLQRPTTFFTLTVGGTRLLKISHGQGIPYRPDKER